MSQGHCLPQPGRSKAVSRSTGYCWPQSDGPLQSAVDRGAQERAQEPTRKDDDQVSSVRQSPVTNGHPTNASHSRYCAASEDARPTLWASRARCKTCVKLLRHIHPAKLPHTLPHTKNQRKKDATTRTTLRVLCVTQTPTHRVPSRFRTMTNPLAARPHPSKTTIPTKICRGPIRSHGSGNMISAAQMQMQCIQVCASFHAPT
ncbi:hypothetical protein LZ32DRAFT_605351 [Colletotrichum eremochloae]|nr:hypothetical protein LZ32DRAFT_605351 [Colletotrichum eremochloae]